MTYANKRASAYLEQEIMSEGPVARIARVYDMARHEVTRARASLTAGDLASKGRAVTRACRCIALLQSSIDREQGEEVGANLDRLYTYLLARLSEAHVNNDGEKFDEVAGHLAELGAAWRDASKTADLPAADPPGAPVEAVAGAR